MKRVASRRQLTDINSAGCGTPGGTAKTVEWMTIQDDAKNRWYGMLSGDEHASY